MSEYCKNCKTMQDEIDRLRRVIKDANARFWDLNCIVYVDLDYLEWLDNEVANNDTSRLTGSVLEVELAKQIEKSPEYYVCPYTGNKIEN